MRRLLLLLVLAATPAAADPKSDSQALYETTMKSSALFADLINAASVDPATAAAAIKEQVTRPLTKQYEAWMSAMTDGGTEAYAPFLVCWQAAITLEGFAADFSKFLRGESDRPDVKSRVGYFQTDLTGCEAALGLPATFAAGAQ